MIKTVKSMTKNRILTYGILVVLVLAIVVSSLFVFNRFTSTRPLRITPTPSISKEEIKPKTNSIVLKTPIIEYKIPGNVYSEATVKGYDEKSIKIGEEFIIDSANLVDPVTRPSRTAENFVGDIKLKLIDIRVDSVVVDILADERFDKKFYPKEKIEREEIKNGSCISAFPLVMDVFYEYCFDILKNGSQIILKPRLKSESTMPLP